MLFHGLPYKRWSAMVHEAPQPGGTGVKAAATAKAHASCGPVAKHACSKATSSKATPKANTVVKVGPPVFKASSWKAYKHAMYKTLSLSPAHTHHGTSNASTSISTISQVWGPSSSSESQGQPSQGAQSSSLLPRATPTQSDIVAVTTGAKHCGRGSARRPVHKRRWTSKVLGRKKPWRFDLRTRGKGSAGRQFDDLSKDALAVKAVVQDTHTTTARRSISARVEWWRRRAKARGFAPVPIDAEKLQLAASRQSLVVPVQQASQRRQGVIQSAWAEVRKS